MPSVHRRPARLPGCCCLLGRCFLHARLRLPACCHLPQLRCLTVCRSICREPEPQFSPAPQQRQEHPPWEAANRGLGPAVSRHTLSTPTAATHCFQSSTLPAYLEHGQVAQENGRLSTITCHRVRHIQHSAAGVVSPRHKAGLQWSSPMQSNDTCLAPPTHGD